MNTCPDTPIDGLTFVALKDRNGYWRLRVLHTHEGDLKPCDDRETYVQLDLAEMVDVLQATTIVKLDGRMVYLFEERDDGTSY